MVSVFSLEVCHSPSHPLVDLGAVYRPLAGPAGANSHVMNFRTLVNPLRHSDHKVLGVTYLVLEALDFYGFMFCERRYSADFLWFMAMKVCGCLVTASALRNFGHLAKSDVNKGMFAESRTFS